MIGVISSLLFVFQASLYRTLDTWKLIPHKESLTELYIHKYDSLPLEVTAHESIPYSFAIHNLEGKDMKYRYAIYASLQGSSNKKLIASGTSEVHDGETKIHTSSYVFGTTTKQVAITIELPDQNQMIHFTLPRRQ